MRENLENQTSADVLSWFFAFSQKTQNDPAVDTHIWVVVFRKNEKINAKFEKTWQVSHNDNPGAKADEETIDDVDFWVMCFESHRRYESNPICEFAVGGAARQGATAAAAVGPGWGAARRGAWGSPKRLYKAPTDYTKPPKYYTKPRQTIQRPKILDNTLKKTCQTHKY